MENGNGQIHQQVTGMNPTFNTTWPWSEEGVIVTPAPIAQPVTEEPAQPAAEPSTPQDGRSTMWTPEARAKLSASMKAAHAKKRLANARRAARIAAAEREAQAGPTAASLDKAIEYHKTSLNTLLAAKALLK